MPKDEPTVEDLRAELSALETLRARLGDVWVDAQQAEIRQQLADVVQTMVEGGAGQVEAIGRPGSTVSIQGSVITQGGDFIGRDQVTINLNPKTAPPEALLRAYYRALAADCRHLPLGVVDPKFVRPGREGEVSLNEIYVDLDVVASPRDEGEDTRQWGLRLARGEGRERMDLLEALAQDDARYVTLLGDPGSGKTTFVNYVTYLLADAASRDATPPLLPASLRDLWPVRLVLRDVAAHLPLDASCGRAAMLWDAVAADIAARLGKVSARRLLPYIQARLLRHGGLFLLDGLDEVPQAGRRRRCLLESIESLVDSLPTRARMVLTARPYAYVDPDWQVPGFSILALAPFSDPQVRRFVNRWYTAVRPAMGWDSTTADERGQRLTLALRTRSYLADLASRPLLLTLMATLHTSWGQLPEDRADLYEESVRLLLSRWQRGREVLDQDGHALLEPGIEKALEIGEGRIRAALEALAYTCHVRQAEESREPGVPADIPQAEVVAAFADRVPDDVNPNVALRYLETRAGLLVGRREGIYTFPHRSFQEYLAACHLSNTESDFAERLRMLVWKDPDWWREVFLLGVGKKRQGGLGDAVNIINMLVPLGPREVGVLGTVQWHAAILAGQALLELQLHQRKEDKAYFAAVVGRVQRWLAGLISEGALSPRARWQAGDILGRLGDPRPGVALLPPSSESETAVVPDLVWCKVGAGPFFMGSTEDDPDADGDEKLQHLLTLPGFYISRYPITNAQFRPFVENGGYDTPEYWTPEGWAWRQGAAADLSVLDGVAQETIADYVTWLSDRPKALRDHPFYWEDAEWGIANRPVVGVTWYEALAYTRWLKRTLKQHGRAHQEHITLQTWNLWDRYASARVLADALRVRLPSEAEWEKAARGTSGDRYSWGDTWQLDCANTEEADLHQTSAVGLFPKGCSPYGLLDALGNTWEWTRSRWSATTLFKCEYGYPYDPEDGREELKGMRIPVLRGGSWLSGQKLARCAHRVRSFPENFSYLIGFRVVLTTEPGLNRKEI
jgi:formylglycine-generating enzyme required for sulfatase activity